LGGGIAYDWAGGDAMIPNDYVETGERFVTEFFDHGGHFQMVTERFGPDGESRGRTPIEDCDAGS
jgi:hypothetical protein